MEFSPEFEQQIQRMRSGEVRSLTVKQTRWVEWHETRFKKVLEEAKNRPLGGNRDEALKQLASLRLLGTISRFTGHVARGVGLFGINEDGVLKFMLSQAEVGGNVGLAISRANVRAGDETAAFLESLLRPYQTPAGLPDNIRIVPERYVPTMYAGMTPEQWAEREPDVGQLRQYDFNYFVIVPFPE